MNLIGENISYKPDNEYHLNNISFNFKKGNLYTILGRTLSGKTTLLKTIAGLINPNGGSMHFEDKNFSEIQFGREMLQWCISNLSITPI